MQPYKGNATEIHRQSGPLLLLAGPGTGKTYRLGQRIKYLVEEEDVSPEQITVITFTKAAATNMRHRITDPDASELFVPSHLQPGIISTMHSLGHRIICEKNSYLGLPENPIVVRTKYLRDLLLGDAAQMAGLSREDAEETAECRQHGDCKEDDCAKCVVCSRYREILGKCGAIDYDDQILLASKLLKQDAQLLSKYQNQALHMLVDEYQDINAGQFNLIKILSSDHLEGLFVVGDDDQSIYSWRGGSPGYIRGFTEDFGPDAEVITLNHVRRCRKNILEAALCVVNNNDHKRLDKGKISYSSSEDGRVVIHDVPSDKREAQIVRIIIEEMDPSETALILIPSRRYLPLIISQLNRGRFEYTCTVPQPGEGLPILERLACWLTNEKDSLALRECIEALLNGRSLGVPSKKAKISAKKKVRLEAFASVSELWGTMKAKDDYLWASLSKNVNRDDLLQKIFNSLKELQEYENKDVRGFLALVADLLNPWATTIGFLDEIQAWVGTFEETGGSPSPRVRVLTFHGAKGLEADVVCVVGVEQGTLPRNNISEEELAEQSRLMLVSMTRAGKELHLFHARKRSGAISFQKLDGPEMLSRSVFIDAIPRDLKEEIYYRPKR